MRSASIDGQKVPIKRTRVRDKQNRERRLGSYELFQFDSRRVWDSVTRGLSGNYGPLVKDFVEAYGVEKSTVSERFVEASRKKGFDGAAARRLPLCTLLIDAAPFKGRYMIVALGIGCDGRKTVLGLREGATENAAVVGELLSDLLTRGLDVTQPRLYVLDGSKALHSAVRKHAGDAALVQRCQVHKRRNVLDH